MHLFQLTTTEKSSKFFLNLEKSRAIQGQVRKLFIMTKKQMMEQKLIIIFIFFSVICINKQYLETYLNTILFPKLTKEKSETLDGGITEKELFTALQMMENNKSPGNNGLTKEFYVTFWNEVKASLLLGVEKAYLVKQLNVSQKQAVIKLIEKKKDGTTGRFKTGDLFSYLM